MDISNRLPGLEDCARAASLVFFRTQLEVGYADAFVGGVHTMSTFLEQDKHPRASAGRAGRDKY